MSVLRAPFPWFGRKSKVSPLVWDRFGDAVPNYVEPFFGSGAVLLGRPHPPGIETVNDIDGFVCNVWRAIGADPDGVAYWADWPSNECDLHARHLWLKWRRETLSAQLMGDPDYFDAKIAGWWLWGMAQWIGSGFCGDSGSGPWGTVDGKLVHLGDAGRGVARKLVHLGDAGRGVARQLVHLGNAGQGVGQCDSDGLLPRSEYLYDYMRQLAARMRSVRVCCGDWERICGQSPTFKQGMTGVFLDPPYSTEADRDMRLYAEESGDVAHRVREWAIANGDNPLLRICLCGYDGEHAMPNSWEAVSWKAQGGYSCQSEDGSQSRANAKREMLYFSPACLRPQGNLFHGMTDGPDDPQPDKPSGLFGRVQGEQDHCADMALSTAPKDAIA